MAGDANRAQAADPNTWDAYVRDSQESLRLLAVQTGGIAIVDKSDLDPAL